jgi:homoserine O-acetyltransferase
VENKIITITIPHFTTESGAIYNSLNLSYQVFGLALSTAPVVLVNHALTGNSQVTGEKGWWSAIIGDHKIIDTRKYTVLAFNIPGNGFDKDLMANYLDFNARDIARLFLKGIESLGIQQLYAIIGGSIGGGIAWEMIALQPEITQHLIPIATDWKSTDWMIANCFAQERILQNSSKPIEDARIQAMLLYRTPASFKAKFNRSLQEDLAVFNIESWLAHHGKKLQERYQLAAYKMMNQILKTIDITRNSDGFSEFASNIKATIHIIAIDSDLFFTANENQETYLELKKYHKKVAYSEIVSPHGHDAFLIEYQQLEKILATLF